jgi:hypothetical protein
MRVKEPVEDHLSCGAFVDNSSGSTVPEVVNKKLEEELGPELATLSSKNKTRHFPEVTMASGKTNTQLHFSGCSVTRIPSLSVVRLTDIENSCSAKDSSDLYVAYDAALTNTS